MRYLIIILILYGSVFAGNAVTYYLGGSSASTSNPYFHESSVAATACIGANGAAIWTGDDDACGACATNEGKTQITITGTLPAISAGTYAYINFSASYTDGFYRVNSRDGDTTFTIECNYIDTSDVDAIRIGGARPATDTEWISIFTSTTNDYNVAAGTASAYDWTTSKVDIKVNDFNTAIDCDETWNITSRVGSASYWVDVWACNGASSPDNWVYAVNGSTLTTTTNPLTTGLIRFNAGADINWYVRIHGFELNGDDKSAYGIAASATAAADDNYVILDQITAHDNTTAGFSLRGLGISSGAPYRKAIHCTSYANGVSGFEEATAGKNYDLYGCIAYSNGGDGFVLNSPQETLLGCLAYANTAKGFKCSNQCDHLIFIGCIADGNGDDGFEITSGADAVYFFGCVASNNVANGFDHNDDAFGGFGWNGSYNNAGNDINNATVEDGNFPTYGFGGNVVGDPKFVNRGTGDFTLSADSPLLSVTNAFWHKINIGMTTTAGGGKVGFGGGFQ